MNWQNLIIKITNNNTIIVFIIMEPRCNNKRHPGAMHTYQLAKVPRLVPNIATTLQKSRFRQMIPD